MLKTVYSVFPLNGRMSSLEGDEPKAKYEFRGKFGGAPRASQPVVEVSHEEIDTFVKSILGLTKNTENQK